ncbi:MAG TPA: TonB-dependent receptor [Alphaproteobacteria bacterium]|nr:TonB-dependent receptor [Alphaproteobacteria bacterium]
MTAIDRRSDGATHLLQTYFGLLLLGALTWAAPMAQSASSEERSTAPVRLEPVVVSAGRLEQALPDVPANVTVLTRDDIERSAARTLDDLLRQIPGFSLFRRSSSLVAHPTTQGVSLRGIGPSGVSRTLVLLDGVPLNDPFGGWVYWSKVPLESIERVEVVRGGGSALYGNYALGGVINIVTRRPAASGVQGKIDVGNRETVDANLQTDYVTDPVALSLWGRMFSTGGFPIVNEEQRGDVDIEADLHHQTFIGRVEHSFAPDTSAFLTGSYFHEDRGNGTPLQENSTAAGYLAAGGRLRSGDGSDWQLTLYSQLQTFNSTFTRIFNNRNAEALTLDQEVPSTGVGGALQWTKQLLPMHLVTAGIDARWVEGQSDENVFNFAGTAVTTRREAGGEQRSFGIFAQDIFSPLPRLQITAALRFDFWQNGDASRTERAIATGALTRTGFPTRTDTALSPKLALLYRATDALSLRGAAYQAFRAPTLNELYRQFRVQNVVTLANSSLGPERLTGGEIGLDYALGEAWLAKVTGFWNELKDPISNVTLSPPLPADCPGGTVCRQRQNLGRTRSRGVEVELHYMPTRAWAFSASYLYNESNVVEFPADPSLEGKRVPQVPKHTYTLGVHYLNSRLVNVAVQGRFVGNQFEDDRNEEELGSFFVVDLNLWRPIPLPLASASEIFLAVENLFDTTYAVGKDPATGVITTGTPLLVHGGLRFRF